MKPGEVYAEFVPASLPAMLSCMPQPPFCSLPRGRRDRYGNRIGCAFALSLQHQMVTFSANCGQSALASPSHCGCVRGYRVGLQDGRRTRQRDRKSRANEFFCHRRQGPNLGQRRLAGRDYRCRRQILRACRIRSAAGGLIGRSGRSTHQFKSSFPAQARCACRRRRAASHSD